MVLRLERFVRNYSHFHYHYHHRWKRAYEVGAPWEQDLGIAMETSIRQQPLCHRAWPVGMGELQEQLEQGVLLGMKGSPSYRSTSEPEQREKEFPNCRSSVDERARGFPNYFGS